MGGRAETGRRHLHTHTMKDRCPEQITAQDSTAKQTANREAGTKHEETCHREETQMRRQRLTPWPESLAFGETHIKPHLAAWLP